jgi:hypothetical protein
LLAAPERAPAEADRETEDRDTEGPSPVRGCAGSMSRLLWGALGAVGSSDQLQGSQHRYHPQNLTARPIRRAYRATGNYPGP